MDRQRLLNLIASISALSTFSFTLGLMFPLLSLIMESHGVSSDVIGYNTAMQPLGIALSVFAIPMMVRRWGAKRAVIGSALAVAIVVIAYPMTPIFWAWFGLRILHGFFVSTLFAVSEAWVVRFSDGPFRSRILAIYTTIMAATFGLGPTIINFTGIVGVSPFLWGAVILTIATLPVFLIKDADVDDKDESPLSILGFARKAWMLLAAVAIFAFQDAAVLSFLPVYGVKRGMTDEQAALALTVLILGNVLFQVPVGWLADRFKKYHVITACVVAAAVTFALIPQSFGTPAYWPILMLCGAAGLGIYSVALGELGEGFSGSDLTAGAAAFSAIWGVGAFIGSLSAGYAFSWSGPDGFPYAMALALAAFAMFRALNWTRRPLPA